MQNYSKGSPVGNNGNPNWGAEQPANFKAVARIVSENGTASSVIGLSHDTTAIEVATGGTPAVIRWIATSDTQASVVAIAGATANYDHVIPANWVRRFVVPVESMPSTHNSVMGANRANGLYQRIAYKTQGIASVFLTEY